MQFLLLLLAVMSSRVWSFLVPRHQPSISISSSLLGGSCHTLLKRGKWMSSPTTSLHSILEKEFLASILQFPTKISGGQQTQPKNGKYIVNGQDNEDKNDDDSSSPLPTKVPFIIDRIDFQVENEFRDVSKMCVDVFFKEGQGSWPNGDDSKEIITPWKALQLAYLRNALESDLRLRKFFNSKASDMFVAREVLPASPAEIVSSSVILDESPVYNFNCLPRDEESPFFIRGDVLGFCEVSERQFGLGEEYDGKRLKGSTRGRGGDTLRPILTNLSVRKDVRNSGVGSRLVEACEQVVLTWTPPYNEIILQVEEDNPSAKTFYENRGYKSIFSDPTCRRFDTSGLFLKQVRATKICMRKTLEVRRVLTAHEKVTKDLFGSSLFRRIRDAVPRW